MRFFHSIKNLSSCHLDYKCSSHIDCICTLLQIVDLILTWEVSEDEKTLTYPYILVDPDKFRRVFIVKHNSIVSLHLPIGTASDDDGKYLFKLRDKTLTPKIISHCKSFVNEYNSDIIISPKDVADDVDIEDEDIITALSLFKCLLTSEMGYLRYDYDTKTSASVFHPKYHLDINCSKLTTYKVGLNTALSLDEFVDIIKHDSPCWYLKPFHKSFFHRFIDCLKLCNFSKRTKK